MKSQTRITDNKETMMKESATATPTATISSATVERLANADISNYQEGEMKEKTTATTQSTPPPTSPLPPTSTPPTSTLPPPTPPTPPVPPPPSEANLDLDRIRLPQLFTGQVLVRKLLATIPIQNPKKHDFIRVHPTMEPMSVWTLVDAQETFVVTGDIAATLQNDVVGKDLVLTITRQGNVFLWALRIPEKDGRINNWHASAREARERAKNGWVRVVSNMDLGAYEVYAAAGVIPDPVWPTLSMDEIVRIAVKGRVIDSLDHPVLRRLRGEI